MSFHTAKLYLWHGIYSLGAFGPWAALPIYALAMSLFLPVSIMGIAAGATFGLSGGFLVISLSSTMSAALVFLIGRYHPHGRGWVFERIEASPKVRAVDDAVTAGGWKMIALIRQTGILPFPLMNYGLGLSKIPFGHYFLATWLSMLPGCLLYAYLGSMAGELAMQGRTEKTVLEWIFFSAGLTVTLGMGIYATVKVKRILSAK